MLGVGVDMADDVDDAVGVSPFHLNAGRILRPLRSGRNAASPHFLKILEF